MNRECFKDNQTGERFSVAKYSKAFFVDETFDNRQYYIVSAEKERTIVNLEERNYLLKFINHIIDN